jgi:CRP-like cAMP-binding protein
MANENVNEVPKALIEKANAAGGHDNITAICVRVPEADEQTDLRADEIALKLEVLKGMPLFRYLSYTELVRVMNIAEVKWYEAGETLIREGEAGEDMFVILSGKVRLNKNGTDITTLGKGAHFGEMSLVDRGTRSASAVADETSRLLLIHRRDFYEIVRKEPSLSVKLLWSFVQVLAERLRKTTADLSGARLAEKAEDLSDDVFLDEPE